MSNLQDGQTATTLRQVAECLRDAAKCIEDAKWRPVEIILLLIPSQLETRVQSDEIQLKKREMLFSRISTKICILFNNPTLQKIPPLKRIFGHFTVLLKLFGRKMDEFHARHVTTADVVIREQFTNMLSMAINWLIHLNEEVDSLHPILNRTWLPIIDIADIEIWPLGKKVNQVKVYVLKVDYREDQVMESLCKFVDNSSLPNFKRPFFTLTTSGNVKDAAAKLALFEAESSPNTCYIIGLVPLASTLDDGAIEVFFPTMGQEISGTSQRRRGDCCQIRSCLWNLRFLFLSTVSGSRGNDIASSPGASEGCSRDEKRGKSKVAAQNCRKRKLDEILALAGRVERVRETKTRLNEEREFLLAEKTRIDGRFAQLYLHVFQSLRDADGRPYNPNEYSLQQSTDGSILLVAGQMGDTGGNTGSSSNEVLHEAEFHSLASL